MVAGGWEGPGASVSGAGGGGDTCNGGRPGERLSGVFQISAVRRTLSTARLFSKVMRAVVATPSAWIIRSRSDCSSISNDDRVDVYLAPFVREQ